MNTAPERIWFNNARITEHMHVSSVQFAGGVEYVRAIPGNTDAMTIAKYDDELRRAVTPSDTSGWRSMDSAPRDGDPFLAIDCNGEHCIVTYEDTGGVFCWYDHADNGYHKISTYSVWTPLPAAPGSQPTQADVQSRIDREKRLRECLSDLCVTARRSVDLINTKVSDLDVITFTATKGQLKAALRALAGEEG